MLAQDVHDARRGQQNLRVGPLFEPAADGFRRVENGNDVPPEQRKHLLDGPQPRHLFLALEHGIRLVAVDHQDQVPRPPPALPVHHEHAHVTRQHLVAGAVQPDRLPRRATGRGENQSLGGTRRQEFLRLVLTQHRLVDGGHLADVVHRPDFKVKHAHLAVELPVERRLFPRPFENLAEFGDLPLLDLLRRQTEGPHAFDPVFQQFEQHRQALFMFSS